MIHLNDFSYIYNRVRLSRGGKEGRDDAIRTGLMPAIDFYAFADAGQLTWQEYLARARTSLTEYRQQGINHNYRIRSGAVGLEDLLRVLIKSDEVYDKDGAWEFLKRIGREEQVVVEAMERPTYELQNRRIMRGERAEARSRAENYVIPTKGQLFYWDQDKEASLACIRLMSKPEGEASDMMVGAPPCSVWTQKKGLNWAQKGKWVKPGVWAVTHVVYELPDEFHKYKLITEELLMGMDRAKLRELVRVCWKFKQHRTALSIDEMHTLMAFLGVKRV